MEYIQLPFINMERIKIPELCLVRAQEFALSIDKHYAVDIFNIFSILGIEDEDFAEYFEVRIGIEVPQYPANDIRHSEPIGILFTQDENRYPKVYALRKDFPQILHMDITPRGFPKSLCIYELEFHEQESTWNIMKFIHDIRNWLERSAMDELHQQNQPIENFSHYHGTLIVGDGTIAEQSNQLKVIKTGSDSNPVFILEKSTSRELNDISEYILYSFELPIQNQNRVNTAPENFYDLFLLVKGAGFDLENKLKDIYKNLNESCLSQKPIFHFTIPLRRNSEDNSIERFDQIAFWMRDTLESIGEKIGLWSTEDVHRGLLLNSKFDSHGAKLILGFCMKIINETSGRDLAKFNNVREDNSNITIIGVGALGSHIIQNCARSNFGRWNIVDFDNFLPHNVARHILNRFHVGYPKSMAVSHIVNNITFDNNFSKPYCFNIRNLDENSDINSIVQQSDIILDCSASLGTARFLSRRKLDAKIISVFLNPKGTDLVIMSEGSRNDISITSVEMQYYKYLLNNESLSNHLEPAQEINYITSCRDKSNIIEQDLVSLHASIASKKIKEIIPRESPFGAIWQYDEYGVRYSEIPISKTILLKSTKWKVETDVLLLESLKRERRKRLPNETGGILLGTYDLIQSKIYIVDFVASPIDSIEHPSFYRRGIEGIEDRLSKIDRITRGNVQYIGEWHSHPNYCSIEPSKADTIQFEWIKETLYYEGFPAMMLIIGEKKFNCIVNNIN